MNKETSARWMKGCQELPPAFRYKRMLGVWFPALKAVLALLAVAAGAAVMSHSILDCTELQNACEGYRSKNREECKPELAELMGPSSADA